MIVLLWVIPNFINGGWHCSPHPSSSPMGFENSVPDLMGYHHVQLWHFNTLGFTMFHPFSANQNTESLRYFWVNLHGDQQPFSHCSRRSSVEAFAACWISAPRRQKPNVGRLLHEKNGGLNGLNGKIIWLVLLCATLSILNNWSFCDIHRSTI